MRVGVVGCGYWGSKHARVLSGLQQVTSLALIDGDATRRKALHTAFPSASSHATLDDIVEDLDAVVIATPPSSHGSLGMKALAAGCHALIEKPFTTSVAEADLLIATAATTGAVLMVGHTFEYNAAVRRLRLAVTAGELGRVHYIDSARLSLGLYQSDVNVLWDLAVHDISIANFVLSSRPTHVAAWGAVHAHRCLEDVATMRLDYPDGITVTLRVSWLDPCKVRRTTIVGSSMMAVYDDLNDSERLKFYDRGVITASSEPHHGFPISYRYGNIVAPYVDFREPLAVEDEHFLECIGQHSTPISDGESGRAVVEVLAAAQIALETGELVAIGSCRDGKGAACER